MASTLPTRLSAGPREVGQSPVGGPSAPDMPGARLWLCVFISCFGATALVFACTLFATPFYGDSTRVGLLSESAFGWRDAQPLVPTDLLRRSEISAADILVIGDSFSGSLVWQSELVRAGLHVATVDWLDTGPLCRNFGSWLRRSGFRGRLVIVESAERELGSRLEAGEACVEMRGAIAKARGPVGSPRVAPPTTLNWSESLFTGVFMAMNTYRAERSQSDLVFGAGRTPFPIRVQSVPKGCESFSHRLCDKGLFLVRDTEQPVLSDRMLEKMASFKRGSPDVAIEWMVLPNKSTVYLDAGRAQTIGPRLSQEGLGPDLFSLLTQSRTAVRDLYAPNDSHLSTTGYLMVGRYVAKHVKTLIQ
jgi:hypothetical protein